MSWFYAGEYRDKKGLNELEGVFLRVVSDSNPSLTKAIKKSKLLRITEAVQTAKIKKVIQGTDFTIFMEVEVTALSFIDMIKKRVRFNIFNVKIPYDSGLICEGDLGKGLKYDED